MSAAELLRAPFFHTPANPFTNDRALVSHEDGGLLIAGIRHEESRSGGLHVQMQRIGLARVEVDAIEQRHAAAGVVESGELRRIEESPRIETFGLVTTLIVVSSAEVSWQPFNVVTINLTG